MQTGDVNIANRTFDIHSLPNETDVSLAVTGSEIRWTYRDGNGDLIRYTKTIENPTHGERGDYIISSSVWEALANGLGLGGFG